MQMVTKSDNAIMKVEQCHSPFSKTIVFHKTKIKVVRLEKKESCSCIELS